MSIERKTFLVTRPAVLAAIAEHDAIGRTAFLTKYGYKPARTYRLWHQGKPYDSKAIIGAAFGYLPGNPEPLRYNEFSGGQIYVVPVLEKLGFSFEEPANATRAINPPWTRDQLILALDLYVRHGGKPLGPDHPEVIELSALINQLAVEKGNADFRNAKGIAMKLMNFRSLDPAFTSKGRVGLKKRGKMDLQVWAEFDGKPLELALAAEAIRAGAVAEDIVEDSDEANSYAVKEGTVSFRLHKVLERDRKVVAIRKAAALKKHGKLECEACGFDYVASYGTRGYGFIEAHHTNPVHAMQEGDQTTPEDLALICANCHRMIHKAKPWLTLSELKSIMSDA